MSISTKENELLQQPLERNPDREKCQPIWSKATVYRTGPKNSYLDPTNGCFQIRLMPYSGVGDNIKINNISWKSCVLKLNICKY